MMNDNGGKIVLLSDRLMPLFTVRYRNKTQRNDILGRLIKVCKEPGLQGCSVKLCPQYTGLSGYDKVRGIVKAHAKWPGKPCVQKIAYASKRGRRRALQNMQQTWPGLEYFQIEVITE